MLMTEYETTVVVRPDIGGDVIESTLDRVREAVRSRGGKMLTIDHWGKKRLAYPIKKQTRGVYVRANYLGRKDLVAEIERNLRISDTVIRFLTVKIAGDIDPDTRQEQAYVRPAYEVEEPAAAEAAAPILTAEEEEPLVPEGDGDLAEDVEETAHAEHGREEEE